MRSPSNSQIEQIHSTTIRTNPHIYPTNTLPNFGTQFIQHILPTSIVNTTIYIPYLRSYCLILHFLLNLLRHLIKDNTFLLIQLLQNPYHNYDTTQPQQIETLHDPQEIFNDALQIVNELFEAIQQNNKTLTLDNTTTVPNENDTTTHEINTDTHSFTVTTNSNTPIIPTRQIEHNTNDNETTSI